MSDSMKWLERRRENLERAERLLAEAANALSDTKEASKDLVIARREISETLDGVYAQLARLSRFSSESLLPCSSSPSALPQDS